MAIPSGSGTEVLTVSYKHACTNSVVTLITGVSNHIYTIISIVYCELAGQAVQPIELYIDAGRNDVSGSGGQDIYLLNSVPLGVRETFVFSDKVVMFSTDSLKTRLAVTANVDIVCTYIDQDWT